MTTADIGGLSPLGNVVTGIYIDDDIANDMYANLNFIETVAQIETGHSDDNESQPYFVANALTIGQPSEVAANAAAAAASSSGGGGGDQSETTTLWCYVCNDFENVSTVSVPIATAASAILSPPAPPPPKVEKGTANILKQINY